MGDRFYDSELGQLYEAGIEWIKGLWKDQDIVYTEIKAKTVGRNRGFVLVITVNSREPEAAPQIVQYFAKIQELQMDMVLSHWVLKEMRCGPEKCLFFPLQVTKKRKYSCSRPFELGIITEEVQGLTTAREIGALPNNDHILEHNEQFLADSFLLSVTEHLGQFSRIPENRDNWGFIRTHEIESHAQRSLIIIDFSSYSYTKNVFQSKSEFLQFWATNIGVMLERCSVVDPVQRNSKDWTSLVAVALVKQSSHFPWLQSKASFLTELQRACDTTAEWLHTVATKCIADRNAAKANRMNLTKDVTSAKTAVAAPDYQSFVEDLNLTIHSALLLLPPHSTSLSVEVVSGAQALVDEARVLKTQICTLMLLKQAEFMDNPANATASLRLKKDKLNLFVEHEIIAHTQQIAAAKNSSTVLLPSPLDDQAEVSRCPLTTSAAVMLVDALTDDGMAHKTRIEASSLADTGCLCGRQEKGISEFSHSGVDDTQGEKIFAPERAPPLLSTDACVGECNIPVMMGAQCTPKQVTSSAFPASTTTRYLTETYGNFTPDSSTPYSPLDHLEAYRVHPRILASDLRSYINRLYKDYEARVKYMNRQVQLFSTWFPYPGNSTSSKKRKR